MKFLPLLCLLSILTSAQVPDLYGTITDTAFGKEFYIPFICVNDINFKYGLNKPYENCQEAGKNFTIKVSRYIKHCPYKIVVLTIMRPAKEFIIYDTTKLPLNIVFENPVMLVKNPPDLRRYHPDIKLASYTHYEVKPFIGNPTEDERMFEREISNHGHELRLRYNSSCDLLFAPVIKFASDTLFIYSNKYELSQSGFPLCAQRSEIIVTGLKSEKYTVVLDGQAFTEQK